MFVAGCDKQSFNNIAQCSQSSITDIRAGNLCVATFPADGCQLYAKHNSCKHPHSWHSLWCNVRWFHQLLGCAPRAACVISTITSFTALRSVAGRGNGSRNFSVWPLRFTCSQAAVTEAEQQILDLVSTRSWRCDVRLKPIAAVSYECARQGTGKVGHGEALVVHN